LSFAGGGTELSPYVDRFGGQVLNSTISLYAYATVQPSADGRVHFMADDHGGSVDCDAVSRLPIEPDLPLHRGVYNRMVRDFHDGLPLPVTVSTFCDAPVGSGLGSSSTLTVAMLKAYAAYLGLGLGEYDLARLAFEVERVDLGLNGGRQDQYAATFGGFNFMEFLPGDRVVINPLRVRDWIRSELEASLVLYYTGTSRESARIIQEQTQRLQAADADTLRRFDAMKLHAALLKEFLLKGDLYAFAQVLGKSWAEKLGTASSVSNDHINSAYACAIAAGAVGGKISGAGGGGFMMLVCDPTRKISVVNELKRHGGTVMNCRFVDEGAQAWSLPARQATDAYRMVSDAVVRPSLVSLDQAGLREQASSRARLRA